MKRPVTPDPAVTQVVNFCLDSSVPLEQREVHFKSLREAPGELGEAVVHSLLEQLDLARGGLRHAQRLQAQLKETLNDVLAPPWFSAVFLCSLPFGAGARAIVYQGGARRVVNLGPDVKIESLHLGDQVFLNHELNLVTGVSPEGPPRYGELGVFDRRTGNGDLVLMCRDEEIVLQAAHPLASLTLQSGDLIRFDRPSWMAFDKVENVAGKEFILDEVPCLTRELLGGLDHSYEDMMTTLGAVLVNPELARRYRLTGRNSILLVGPPGCGKTHMTRIVVSELGRLSGRRARFGVVKPGAWESPYVGATQKAIRDTFRSLRDAARDGLAFLFLDELESIARTRGHFANIHSDKHLAALLAELDGFQDRQDIGIIAATNRKDLLDPALLARFSSEVQVERPDQLAARQILGIHLPPELPFAPNGVLAAGTRDEIIEKAISLLYAPNADNVVCRIRFRDGKDRTITARELISGRLFMQLCESACRRAYARERRGGVAGITAGDMEHAVVDTIDRLRTQVTPTNAHAHLANLPQDVDVVSVEPVVRKVPNRRRYITLDPI